MSGRVSIGAWGAVPLAMLTDPNVKPNMLKVYIAISARQGMNENCWPSRESLAKTTGIEEHRVSVAVSALVEAGWIERIQRSSTNQTNIYRALYDVREPVTKDDTGGVVTESETGPVSENVTSLIYTKTTSENNTTAAPSAPKKKDPSVELTKYIMETFTEHTPITSTEYPREGAAAKRIAKIVLEMEPEFPQAATAALLSHFLYMTEHGDRFWQSQPYRASVLASGGILNRVIHDMRRESIKNDIPQEVLDFAKR